MFAIIIAEIYSIFNHYERGVPICVTEWSSARWHREIQYMITVAVMQVLQNCCIMLPSFA